MSGAIGGGSGGGNSDPFGSLGKMLDPAGLISGLVGGIEKMLKGGDASNISKTGNAVLNQVGSFEQGGAAGASPGVGQDSAVTQYPTKGNEGANGWASIGDKATEDAKRIAKQKADEIRLGQIPSTAFTGAAVQSVAAQSSVAAAQQSSAARAQQSSAATAQQSPAANAPQTSTPAAQSSGATAQQTSAATAQVPKASGLLAQAAAAMSGTQPPEQKTQGPDQKAQTPEQKEEAKKAKDLSVLITVSAEFLAFDTQGWDRGGLSDKKFDKRNLENVAGDANYPPDLREAAKYLLDNPELLRKLQCASGGGTGMVTQSVVDHCIGIMLSEKHTARASQLIVGGAPPVTGTPVPPPVVGTQPPGSPPVGGTPNPGTRDQHTTAGSLDQRLAQMGQSLEDKQNELIRLYNTPEEKLTPDEKRRILALPVEIQKATHRFQQMHDVVSNLMKTFHDMSMTSIRHLG